MAIVSLSTIKNWFKTGLKPTQAQFWDTWDSFRHKSEAVPYADIAGLDAVLLAQDVKINAIALPDDVIKDGVVYVSGTNVDILANDFIWRLLQVQYTNEALYHTVLPFSASGYTRTDIFVGTNLGTIYRVAGEQRVGVAFKPSVPPGTIEIASVDVDDAVVGTPVIPKPKQPVTSVNGMRGEVVLTKSDIGLGNVDNISDVNKPVSTAQAAADAVVLATAQSYTDSKVSSVYKFKGNVANYAALPSTGLTVGDVYNLSDTGANYAWTGTVWDDLGTTVDISGKENVSNKSQDIETDKTSTSKYGSVKAVYDWAVAKFQAVLVSGTNIKTINGTSLLGSGDITVSGGGGGDMVLASTQTVSGLKTFLSGMFGLRNVANTFTSFFTNSNTAARTYTLKDRNGTLIDDTDYNTLNSAISGKMANPAGTANYLSKFLTATTIGLSRLWDTGTFLGIGTANAPTKDITLGNQENREIGVELSPSTVAGRNLIVCAGSTINYVLNSNFISLNYSGLPSLNGYENTQIIENTLGDIYLVNASIVYCQTAGIGNFNVLQDLSIPRAINYGLNGDVYVVSTNGSSAMIFRRVGGTGSFNNIATFSHNGSIAAVCVNPSNGDVYASIGGDLKIQAGGTGSFISSGISALNFNSMCFIGTHLYGQVISGGIYKRVNNTGVFSVVNGLANCRYIAASKTNTNIYALSGGNDPSPGGIYLLNTSTDAFTNLNQASLIWNGICCKSNSDNLAVVRSTNIYIQQNNALGANNLDGGALKVKAGTGKGTGKSRFEIYTGQKTASGTNMQVETLREYIDENGYHVYTSIPVYADNAAAIAGGLPVGCEYRTATGVKMIVY